MKRATAILIFWAVLEPSFAQNIFDDDPPETTEPKPTTKPVKSKIAEDESVADEEKPVVKLKKKKRNRKKRKSAVKEKSQSGGYSAEEIARASYSWAPETEPLMLSSSAPGIRGDREAHKSALVDAKFEAIEAKPAAQGFRLPQIPIAQVLIVAGFVVLFLIYRFRVGRQMKRKRY